MNRGWFQFLSRDNTGAGFYPGSILEPPEQIQLDVVRRDFPGLASPEGFLYMQTGAQIGLVCFLGAEERLGIVFQEKIHPR
jgi:hypothetical protein